MTADQTTSDRAAAALSISGLSKTFAGTRALIEVDLEVGAGQVHAIVGQNGSGKSTLVKVLAGYHVPDAPSVASVNGRQLDLGSAQSAASVGVRFVHQDLALIGSMNAAENMELVSGRGPWLRRIRWRRLRRSTRAALQALGYDIDVAKPVSELSDSERTAVAVARALRETDQTSLLVLDEPTAALPAPEVDALFAALKGVAARGIGVLFISHHLDEVLSIADLVTVFRDGRRVTTQATAELNEEQLADLMLGRKLRREMDEHRAATAAEPDAAARPALLRIRDLHGETVAGFDLDVHANEVVGIVGLTGSGIDELPGLIFGATPRQGQIHIGEQLLPPGNPRASIASGIAMIPSERLMKALFPEWTVASNMTLAGLRQLTRRGLLNGSAERRQVHTWLERLSVVPRDGSADILTLSGGNQQKVVLARWLRMDPKILVLEEPTQGVDVGAKADIHVLVDEVAAGGAAVLLASSDSEEVAALCKRVLVMVKGRVSTVLTGDDVSPEMIARAQLVVAPS